MKILAAIALVLLAAAPAWAVGPLVGTNCADTLLPPTTFADGTPLTEGVTINVWVLQGVQTAPARLPDITGITGTSVGICTGRPAGQYTSILSAKSIVSGLESVISNAIPFVLVIPNPVTALACTPAGACSWTLPTANTDATPITGPIITELWVLRAPATIPSGPPTQTATGTSASITIGPAGNYNVVAKAMTTPTLGGSTSESAALVSPFVVSSAPGAPINSNVR